MDYARFIEMIEWIGEQGRNGRVSVSASINSVLHDDPDNVNLIEGLAQLQMLCEDYV